MLTHCHEPVSQLGLFQIFTKSCGYIRKWRFTIGVKDNSDKLEKIVKTGSFFIYCWVAIDTDVMICLLFTLRCQQTHIVSLPVVDSSDKLCRCFLITSLHNNFAPSSITMIILWLRESWAWIRELSGGQVTFAYHFITLLLYACRDPHYHYARRSAT